MGKSNETLEQEIEQLRNELDQLKQEKPHEYADSERVTEETRDVQDQTEDVADDTGTSRRKFLKAAGLGAASLGAAAVGSSLEIKSDYPFKYSNKSASTPNFEIDTQGNVDLNGNDISNVGSLDTGQLSSTTTDTEELSGTYDALVSSTSELESAFNNLSAGETIQIARPATPYRTTQWLDIDVDDVTIKVQSTHAEDGQALIKPADGADVGGIRVGVNTTATVENVTIAGVGFDGNESTMTDSVKRLHGLIVNDAKDVVIRNCYFTKTHPYQEHNSGGSGISIKHLARRVRVTGCEIYDIGDRGVQCSGEDCSIHDNLTLDGYDRSIALDNEEGGQSGSGTFYHARGCVVANNTGINNSNGSMIGASAGNQRSDRGHHTIVGNLALGDMRKVVVMKGNQQHDAIVGNKLNQGAASQGQTNENGIVVGANNSVVVGNTLTNIAYNGILLEQNDIVCVGNIIKTTYNHGIKSVGVDNIVTANIVRDAAEKGIHATGGWVTVSGNHVRQSGRENIHIGTNDFSGYGSVVTGNHIEKGDQDGAGGIAEIQIDGSDSVIANNLVVLGAARCFQEGSGANDNVFVGNNSDTDNVDKMFTINGNKTRLYANNPTHYDLDEILGGISGGGTSLSSAIPRASLGDDIEINVVPNIDPNNDLAFDARVFWDDSAGSLKVQVEETANSGGGDARVRAKLA